MKNYAVKDRNAMWKGGRSIASNGYVLIRVGVEHHLSDVRGYAYEHRILAEQIVGEQHPNFESTLPRIRKEKTNG